MSSSNVSTSLPVETLDRSPSEPDATLDMEAARIHAQERQTQYYVYGDDQDPVVDDGPYDQDWTAVTPPVRSSLFIPCIRRRTPTPSYASSMGGPLARRGHEPPLHSGSDGPPWQGRGPNEVFPSSHRGEGDKQQERPSRGAVHLLRRLTGPAGAALR